MEKVAPPGGGGPRLHSLDMQSYLEVMGRQLDEIQAQHHQFYASRPERNGRMGALRQQEHTYRAQRASSAGSGSTGTPLQRASHTPSEARGALDEVHSRDTLGVHGTPTTNHTSTSQGRYHSVARSPSARGGHSGARRSLAFYDSPLASGNPHAAGGSERSSGLRSSSSTPLLFRVTDGGSDHGTDAGASPTSRPFTAQGSGQRSMSPAQAYSYGLSVSPSSVSFRPHNSNTATPSVSISTQLTGAATPYSTAHPSNSRPGTASTSDCSAPGPYRVVDANAPTSPSYSTPETEDADRPLMASVRSSTQAAAHGAWRRAQPECVDSSPRARQAPPAHSSVIPSADSVPSTAFAVYGLSAVHEGEAVSEDEGMPYTLALAGQAFDGIDSEEDEDHDSEAAAGFRQQERYSVPPLAGSGASPSASGSIAGKHEGSAGPTSRHRVGSGWQTRGTTADSRPPSRAPLRVASLETEEALRALLASTRFPEGIQASTSTSVDAEGADVPDDVLAALASTNPAGLDALLGAATATVRERSSRTAQARLNPSRPATQSGGEAGEATSVPASRRVAFGPGALTAAPAAVPPSVVARGAEASPRTAGTPRQYGVAVNTAPAGGPFRTRQQPVAAGASVDASIDASELDMLSRTLEVQAEAGGLLATEFRGSAAYSAAAMAMQLAAAQAHAQPVLYGRAVPRPAASDASDDGGADDGAGEQLAGSPRASQAAAAAVPANAGNAARPALPQPPASPATRSRGQAGSPSVGSSRPGGDGDSVLYGSPRRNTNASGAAATSGGAESPYVPPSPPPGADPAPYVSSPTVPHGGSRLHHSSRDADVGNYEDVGQYRTADTGSRSGHGNQSGERASAAGATASGVNVNNSRRLFTKLQSSGTTSGTASVSFDLSLTQAAAAGGGRVATGLVQLPATASIASSAGSLQRVPTPIGTSSGRDAPSQPFHSKFSVLDVATTGRSASQVASYDLEVDDTGRPMPPTASPRAAGAGASMAAKGAVSAAGEGRIGHQAQPQPAGPPLAAFSRAAALAAAADLGLVAPPVLTAASRREPSAEAASARTGAVTPECETIDMHRPVTGCAGTQEEAATLDPVQDKDGQGRPSAGTDKGATEEDQSQHFDQPAHSLSPAPPSASSNAVKLIQLKARRQQQWQSQHGVNGHPADQPATASDAAAQLGQGGQAPAPVAPALLSGAVAEAIARAAHGGMEITASGELNLGHGISGLSVAIEAGQVKWAWQTGVKDSPRQRQGETPRRGAASPGASSGSPWASPIAGEQEATGFGSEWAQLPPPQWQRHGQLPPSGPQQVEERADRVCGRAQPQHGGPCNVHRRHSEYSLPTGPGPAGAEKPLAAPQYQFAATAGGPSGQDPHQLRDVASAEVGDKASNRAAALMRLKRQSIMRHTALTGSKEVEEQHPDYVVEQQQGQLSSPQFQQPTPRAVSSSAQHAAPPQQEPQRRSFSARVRPAAPKNADSAGEAPREREQRIDGDAAAGDGDGPAMQPKPFLRRRSAKIEAKKVDWSHVKPRTNTRNSDYYADPLSPRGRDPYKQHASPARSPNGAAKPPLNVRNGGRAWKPGGKLPQTPTEEEKAAAAAAARRRMSNIPVAPIYAAGYQATAKVAAEENRVPGAHGGRGAARGGAISPLDDLLAHVNTLLRDFDKIVL